MKPTAIDNAKRPYQYGLARNRAHSFGLTMIVMGASFILYYLGLFGTVDGPLSPDKLGTALAGLGVTRQHVIGVLLFFLFAAVSWNWIFNLSSLLMGRRLTCAAPGDGPDGVCGAPVQRRRRRSKRSGRTGVEYACGHGHRQKQAHFHPVKKGTLGHTVWAACLVFVLIAICCAKA